MGGNYYISCKLIDVQNARIEKQKTVQTQRGTGDLIEAVQKVTGDMFAAAEQQTEKPVQEPVKTGIPAEEEKQKIKPAVASGLLIADRRNIYRYHDGTELLDKYDVRDMMATNTYALQLYNKGLKRNRNGNILLVTGLCMVAGGGVIFATVPFELRYEYNDWYTGENCYDYEFYNYLLGVGMAGVGAVMSLTGVTLKITSRIPVKKSVRVYNNNSLNTTGSNMELKLDFTGNGVRLALTF
jgi:hypothetical protein